MSNTAHVPALPDVILEPIVRLALLEDLSPAGDLTSDSAIDADAHLAAEFRAREAGVIAGMDAARLALRLLDADVTLQIERGDGATVAPNDCVATIGGAARSILMAERTMLNFMGHLSGIATLTRRYVEAVSGTRARITCTRKTTPGWRKLEKYAVRCGGGQNHRMSLSDAALVKDNHIAAAGGVAAAFQAVRQHAPDITVEIEVDTLDQLREALGAGADLVLLDNMEPSVLREAVSIAQEHTARTGKKVLLEASGGLTLATAGAVGATGVDFISVGGLTHSSPILDIGLDYLRTL